MANGDSGRKGRRDIRAQRDVTGVYGLPGREKKTDEPAEPPPHVEREPMATIHGDREERRRAEAQLPRLPRDRADRASSDRE
jgi:hypothetical protein